MKTKIVLAGLVLTLVGAGCLGGGSNVKTGTGGVWSSLNGGKSWSAKNTLVTATALSSISGADILSLERDPSNANVLYAGTKESGLLYSLDGGASFQRPPEETQFDLVRKGAILDIAVDPKDPCTFYVLKSDRLMKTESCGRTFDTETYVETRTNEELTALALDWYNSENVWLGTTAGDVIRSTDGGNNWATLNRVKDEVTALLISNADSRIILVGTARNSLYRTTDSGATWTSLEKDLRDFKKADRVSGFAETADGKTVIMNTAYGLLKSEDNGATWKGLTLVTAEGEVKIFTMGVAPTDGDVIVYGTDSTFYRSTNGGSSWTTQELPTSRAASVILFDPEDANSMLLGVQAIEKK
jgi:photosystem II stability/assembly factor-like uncharacterized protein